MGKKIYNCLDMILKMKPLKLRVAQSHWFSMISTTTTSVHKSFKNISTVYLQTSWHI